MDYNSKLWSLKNYRQTYTGKFSSIKYGSELRAACSKEKCAMTLLTSYNHVSIFNFSELNGCEHNQIMFFRSYHIHTI